MTNVRPRSTATFILLCCATAAMSQQSQPTSGIPKLVRFSGVFHATNGTSTGNMESVTLAVYRDQTGEDELWHEVQNVTIDADGRYSILMGATQNEGMPLDLFASGEPRWLGVRFNRPGEAEQPRVLLVSVPYALKASDAETLGGKPASAYLLAPSVATDVAGSAGSSTAPLSTTDNTALKPRTVSGQINRVAKFVDANNDVGNSSLYDANGLVGISTAAPLISLDVRTGPLPQMGIAGTTDYLTFFASDAYGPAIYWDPAKDMRFGKGGSGLYNPFGFVEQMRIQSGSGNVGIGTMAPGSKLDAVGDINFSGSVRFQGSPVLRLYSGTNGQNSALGLGTLSNDRGPGGNTAIGSSTLASNTFGGFNTSVGISSLVNNTEGGFNTVVGYLGMSSNTTGGGNVAVGLGALGSNITGNNNIALGNTAGGSLQHGDENIYIGDAGVFGNETGSIRIGNSALQTSFFAAGIRGATTGTNDAIPVVIDSNGQLGTVSSSRRFKENIEDMGDASSNLMHLRPVTFRYTKPFADGSKPIQYGLIAEEVAEVYPDLVAHSADGQIETVKYQVLDSMLLNEVQRQQAEIRGLEQQNRTLQERLNKLEDKLEKVLTAISRSSGSPSGQ